MKNTHAYRALCATAERIGWPEHYQDDLYFHDHARLCGGEERSVPEGEQFAWLVRQCGTWIVAPGDDLYGILSYVERFEAHHRAFWWDGSRLTEIPLSAVRANVEIAASLELQEA